MTPADVSSASTGLGLAKLARASFWAGFREMKWLFGGAAIFSMIVAAIFFYITDVVTLGAEPLHSVLALLLVLPRILLLAIIVAPAMIALHRFILLDPASSSTALMKVSYEKSFFLWWLGFNLLLIFIGVVAGLVGWFWPGIGTPATIVLLVGIVITLRLILIFPAVATEVPSTGWRNRIEASRNQMRGRFWLLIRAYFLLALPIAIVFALIKVPLIFLSAGNSDASGWINLGLEILDAFVQFVLVLLAAALASWLYAFARKDAEGISS
jgi:hypothetical protein